MSHLPIPILTPAEIKRFWSHIDLGPEIESCWEWRNWRRGVHAQFWIRGQAYLAHRIAWRIKTGRDPGDKLVCHACDNPPCVRHLFLGTQYHNMQDMIRKGRDDHYSVVLRGEQIGTARLTERDVIEIWRLHLHEGLGERKLAALFKVTGANIHHILSGKSWKHLIPQDLTYTKPPVNGFRRRLPTRD